LGLDAVQHLADAFPFCLVGRGDGDAADESVEVQVDGEVSLVAVDALGLALVKSQLVV
jgi:hypothetical protein